MKWLWLLLAWWIPGIGGLSAQPVVTHVAVQTTTGNDASLPGDDALWLPFTLPYQEALDEPLPSRYRWFRLPLAEPPGPGEYSLYLNNHMFTVTVFLNGQRIGGSDVPEGHLALGWNRPLLIRLPRSLWQPSGNMLTVRLELARFTNFLSPFLIGPHAPLQEIWREKVFLQNQVPVVAFVLCVLMGGFTLALWWQRRRDVEYGLFAGTALGWSLPMLYLAISYDVLPHAMFLILVYWAVLASGYSFLLFNLRTLGVRLPRAERAFMVYLVCVSLMIPLADAKSLMVVVLMGQGPSLLVLAVLLGYAMRRALRPGDHAARWVAGSGLVILVLLGRDVYEFSSSARSNTMVSSGTYMQFSFPIALTAFFVQLLRRFVQAYDESERLNAELQARVNVASRELEASYAANRELALQQAAEQQKQKIYRDLHDDVGARLVSIMHARASDEQATMARSALESLRETVAGPELRDATLSDLVGSVRQALELRCRQAELGFHFYRHGSPDGRLLDAVTCYQVDRVLQEALTNAIKHARASAMTLRVTVEPGLVRFALEDDGAGMSAIPAAEDTEAGSSGPPGGNGLRIMRQRAREIGADLTWEAAPGGGCRVLLVLPVPVP